MSPSDFTVPAKDRCFEDYLPGAVLEYGAIPLSESEIIRFAKQFDPQYFHVDTAAAENGPYGGLIASGWHTAAVMMRLIVDHYLPTSASLGSPGIDEIRWTRPVRPGDSLSVRITILEAKRSTSKPDRGMVRALIEVLNQNQECVMTMKGMNLMRCRSRKTSICFTGR
jgi:acyl dehydratase